MRPGYTGMNSPMKERHWKGVAIHPDPDSCGGHREVAVKDGCQLGADRSGVRKVKCLPALIPRRRAFVVAFG